MNLTVAEILWLGIICVIVAVAVIYLVVWVSVVVRYPKAQRPRVKFFQTLILGTDNRTSTSKTTFLVWTLLVVWGLTSLLVAGELVRTQACVGSDTPVADRIKACTGPPENRRGLMQLSWRHLRDSGLDPGYLVLLGIPAAAAVAAKAITQAKDDNGNEPKTTEPDSGKNAITSAVARVGQLFSNDDGTTDLGDTQYLLFNAVLAGYFVLHLAHPDGRGLPPLPDTLLGLTSVSAATYVAKWSSSLVRRGLLPGGGVVEVEAAGAIEGFFGGACEVAAGQD